MAKRLKNINNSFFFGLDLKTKLILVLGALAFVVIVADLSMEISKEKDEIGFFIASLENLDDVGSDIDITALLIPSTDLVVLLDNDFALQKISSVVHSERGPPPIS